jgi:hypothetical protein
MPEPLLKLISKMSKSQLQIMMSLLCIFGVTGGSAYSSIIAQVDLIKTERHDDKLKIAVLEERLSSMSEKIDQIYQITVKNNH